MNTTNFSPYALNLLYPHAAYRVEHAQREPAVGVVGTAFTARADLPIGTFTGSVVSAPAGSSASWSTNTFTPDVPGRYKLRGTNGTVPVDFDIVAFPAAALTYDLVADRNRMRRGPPHDPSKGNYNSNGLPVEPRPTTERWTLLGKIARYGFPDATFAALTTNAPIPLGMAWSMAEWD